ncbi:hypothetical protein [Polynucleobacter sp. CS-Odin-A6]|uniref:hypothetical protein n=1 Tax=Polynucleobacter sp. CS-Odin-A6 TaxID=2689106 RepID=UPI001C0B5C52|nr:hypothetical protein [Polynucleobacter sp. CS-Odin-A6]MBU3621119.1 hypothetical protein [Polynucleobacter sp. CS-Odin-A6]
MSEEQAYFYTGGTLGDAFIVACKLYKYHSDTAKICKLIRFTSHPSEDSSVQALYKYFPYISTESVLCNGIDDEIKKLESASKVLIPINSRADGKAPQGLKFFQDPDYIRMDPFPKLSLKVEKSNILKRVVIQVQSGKQRENYKFFDKSWLRKLVDYLATSEDLEIILVGKVEAGENFYEELAKTQDRRSYNKRIINLVNKTTLEEWLCVIAAADFFISPEGFAAFFAMSQRVRSLVFFTDYQVIDRIPIEWRLENTIMSAGWAGVSSKIYRKIYRRIYSRYPGLAPLKPEQVYSMALLKGRVSNPAIPIQQSLSSSFGTLFK